jgi:hypothetical protein
VLTRSGGDEPPNAGPSGSPGERGDGRDWGSWSQRPSRRLQPRLTRLLRLLLVWPNSVPRRVLCRRVDESREKRFWRSLCTPNPGRRQAKPTPAEAK